jgi:hypothetical protein
LAGCAGNVAGAPGDAEVATTTSAVVVVERAFDATEGSRAEGSARFVRVTSSASAEAALRAIGAALELPAAGTCANLTALTGNSARSDPAPIVELVDVGGVWLEAAGVATHLLPRQLPDITDVVSGVVYARAAEPALLPAETEYIVHVAGGRDLAAFQVYARAPEDPSTVRVTGENRQGVVTLAGPTLDLTWPVDSGAAADDHVTAAPVDARGHAAAGHVTAAPFGHAADSSDVLYMDARPDSVRCVFDNVGHASVSTMLLGNAGTVIVHRLHRDPLRAPGIDSGEVRFDFARAGSYLRP